MADPKGPRPNQSLWPSDSKSKPTPAPKPGASPAAPPSSKGAPADRPAGRVVHDDRGNAVWDWVKETGRVCIESTSAMLKRLEIPGLKMEGEKDSDLRLEEDRDPGGGYDPYNQKKPVPKGKPPTRK